MTTNIVLNIISRADAKAAGLTRFFTGKVCPHGHIAERYTSSHRCVECALSCKRNPAVKHHDQERADAKESGSKTYHTGLPCKHGHLCERYTSNGYCVECARDSKRRTRNKANKANKDKKVVRVDCRGDHIDHIDHIDPPTKNCAADVWNNLKKCV